MLYNQNRSILSLLVLTTVILAKPSIGQTITFSETEFCNSEWEAIDFFHGNGGASTAFQNLQGGNPNSYLQVLIQMNDAPAGDFTSVWTFFSIAGAEHDPSTQNAIETIDSMQDAIVFSEFPQSIRVGLRQNGEVYSAGGEFPTGGSWTTVQFLGLTESDFARIDPVAGYPTNLDDNPDFSASGSNIEFGFLRTNSTSFDGIGVTTDCGVDNWSITLVLATYVLGDINCDNVINLLDVAPFIELISTNEFDEKADVNQDGSVNLLDVGPFVALLGG